MSTELKINSELPKKRGRPLGWRKDEKKLTPQPSTNEGGQPSPANGQSNEQKSVSPVTPQNQTKPEVPVQPLKKGDFRILLEKLLFSIENITFLRYPEFQKNSDEDVKKSADELDQAIVNTLNLGGWGVKRLMVSILILLTLVVCLTIDYVLRFRKAVNSAKKAVSAILPLKKGEDKKDDKIEKTVLVGTEAVNV